MVFYLGRTSFLVLSICHFLLGENDPVLSGMISTTQDRVGERLGESMREMDKATLRLDK